MFFFAYCSYEAPFLITLENVLIPSNILKTKHIAGLNNIPFLVLKECTFIFKKPLHYVVFNVAIKKSIFPKISKCLSLTHLF